MIGIYKIENLINGKVYIGQSINISERFTEHKRETFNFSNKTKFYYHLYCAIRKYGLENFSFSVIEECSEKELDEREIFWIKEYNSYQKGYNKTLGGNGIRTITEEQIKNILLLWEEGLSVGQISVKMKINNHAVIDYLKHYSSSYSTEKGRERGRIINGVSHQKKIACFDLNDNLIKIYPSLKEAAKDTCGDSSSISRCCKGKQKIHKNFIWKYY